MSRRSVRLAEAGQQARAAAHHRSGPRLLKRAGAGRGGAVALRRGRGTALSQQQVGVAAEAVAGAHDGVVEQVVE